MSYNQSTMRELINMRLHEELTIKTYTINGDSDTYWHVTRVSMGWIYVMYINDDVVTSKFVPFSTQL